jgi:DNA-directed RNA polymerase I, II, and III subunit RPABC2
MSDIDDDTSVSSIESELEDLGDDYEGAADEEPEVVQYNMEEEEEGNIEEDEDEEDLEDLDEDENIINVSDNHKCEIVSKDKSYERIESKKRLGSPIMTLFELTKIIGIRSQQIASGMTPLVEVSDNMRDTKFIAIKELLEKKMPLIIRRYYPNNLYVDWRVEELILPKNILF